MAASGLNITLQPKVMRYEECDIWLLWWILVENDRTHQSRSIDSRDSCVMYLLRVRLQEDEDILTRWKHLALLVEFALSMQRTLQNINDQSFNHFVLRMGEIILFSCLKSFTFYQLHLICFEGINHGPTTAGVIGATKPHYDIWGNAVNVASRMESTGKAGCIQVLIPCKL